MRPELMELPRLTVHLMGGLGNQLFQYAFGRSLAVANGAELLLDASGYARPEVQYSGAGPRKCELEYFRIVARVVRDHEGGHQDFLALRRKARKIARFLKSIADLLKPYFERQEIVEPRSNYFRFDQRVLRRRFRRTLSVRGFWQSEKYFAGIGEQLRAELTLRQPMGPEAQNIADQIQNTESVAVHVRHGDNANPSARSMGVLPLAYYAMTMQAIDREIRAPKFFVFSDDGGWARGILGGRPGLEYVAQDERGEAHQDLQLMSMCRHHILANSTLSWWGAWLGKKSGQIVYAPRRYYQNSDRPNPDLYPEGWRLV